MDQILQYLQSNPIFQQGAFAAALIGAVVGTFTGMITGIFPKFFGAISSAFNFLWSRIKRLVRYNVYFDEANDFYEPFVEWFYAHHPDTFRSVEVKLVETDEEDIPTMGRGEYGGRYRRNVKKSKWSLKFFQYGDFNWIKYKGRTIFITKSREKLEHAGNIFSVYFNSYTIWGFFAKRQLHELCQEVLALKLSREQKTLLSVYHQGSYSDFVRKDLEIVKTFEHLYFEGKEQLIQDLDKFDAALDTYRSLGINHKRGYLFYGNPGTGKTSIAKAIASYLQRPLYIISLSNKDDKSIINLVNDARPGSVILFEDIDCILDANRETKDNVKFNFSTFLNILDGLYSPERCIFVLTTNHPETIDYAILRKGRIDYSARIDYPCPSHVKEFLDKFYSTSVQLSQLPNICNVPMSEIQDICLRNDGSAQALEEINKLHQDEKAL